MERREFGELTFDILDEKAGILRKGQENCPIKGKPFLLLKCLTSQSYATVTHGEIGQKVWPDTNAEIGTYIQTALSTVRALCRRTGIAEPEVDSYFVNAGGSVKFTKSVNPVTIDDGPALVSRGRLSKNWLDANFRRLLHHYHLTLDRIGRPVWLYTKLPFDSVAVGEPLKIEASICLTDSDKPEDNRYIWQADSFGSQHLRLTVEKGDADVGVEIFPFASGEFRVAKLPGVRLNDPFTTWPLFTSSIAILSKEPLQGLEDLPEGSVDPNRFPQGCEEAKANILDLQKQWRDTAVAILRLPEDAGAGGITSFASFSDIEEEIKKRLLDDHAPCRRFRMANTWLPALTPSQSSALSGWAEPFISLAKNARVEIVLAHPDFMFTKYRGLAVFKKDDVASAAKQISNLRRQLRRLVSRENLSLRFTDLPIPASFIQIDGDIFFSLFWANSSAACGPWYRIAADSFFGKQLQHDFEWLASMAADSEYDEFPGRPSVEDNLAEDAIPPVVDHLHLAIHGKPNNDFHVRSFWKRYLDDPPSRKRMLIYGEPLFGCNPEHTEFRRNVGQNAPPEKDMLPCRTFLNSGEVKCMLELLRWFSQRGVLLEEQGRDENADLDVFKTREEKQAHGIVLGMPYVNGIMHDYQLTLGQERSIQFKVKTKGIFIRDDAGEFTVLEYEDQMNRHVTYALVTRSSGIKERRDSVVTLISSDVGRAIEGIGKVLTDEFELAEIRRQIGLDDETPWPPEFQLVFEVTLDRNDKNPASQKLKDWWPWLNSPSESKRRRIAESNPP